MKTTSRKRLLISSVAMLLVAMLALGTATFAWFTQNTSATADEFSARTVKASELKLSSKNVTTWTESLHYNYDKVLKPVSTVNGKTWFTAVAADKDNSTASLASAKELTGTEIPDYAIVDQLNIRNFGGAAVEKVKINFTLNEKNDNGSATDYKYLRVALVKVDKAGDTSAKDYPTKFADSVYAAGTDSAMAISSLDKDAKGNVTKINEFEISAKDASSDTFSISVGDLEAYNEKDPSGCTAYYNLYAWFEGQDENCKDAYAGNVMPKITFTVTGDTANQQTGK